MVGKVFITFVMLVTLISLSFAQQTEFTGEIKNIVLQVDLAQMKQQALISLKEHPGLIFKFESTDLSRFLCNLMKKGEKFVVQSREVVKTEFVMGGNVVSGKPSDARKEGVITILCDSNTSEVNLAALLSWKVKIVCFNKGTKDKPDLHIQSITKG